MARPKKITWDVIYRDFRRHFPNLKKMVIDWRPYDYAMIVVTLKDKRHLTYDYDMKTVKFIELRKE